MSEHTAEPLLFSVNRLLVLITLSFQKKESTTSVFAFSVDETLEGSRSVRIRREVEWVSQMDTRVGLPSRLGPCSWPQRGILEAKIQEAHRITSQER